MAVETHEFRRIEDRRRELQDWLQKKAPECLIEQKHLKESGPERAYWAHGYLSALSDVMRLFMRGIPGHEDTRRSRYAA
jgi:hypothetical protein